VIWLLVTQQAFDSVFLCVCADANDAAQFAELKTQGDLTRRAWERDVQVSLHEHEHPRRRLLLPSDTACAAKMCIDCMQLCKWCCMPVCFLSL